MAGINRLGKGVLGKPGRVMHAPDLNRNRTLDFFSEETGKLESDRDYQRTVQDIEDAAQTQGWLFSRGAFDKTDLLYLRDAEEKSRHTEMELHDKEVMAYARLRTQNEKRKPATSLLGSIAKKREPGARQLARSGKPVITISKAGVTSSKPQLRNLNTQAQPQQRQQQQQQQQQQQRSADSLQRQQQSPAADDSRQQQQQQQLKQQQQSPDPASSESVEAPATGLGDLLGSYGSDSDDDACTKTPVAGSD